MSGVVSEQTENRLKAVQHELFEKNMSVLIMVEGGGGALMSQLINSFMSLMEPRGMNYYHFDPDDNSKYFNMFSYLTCMPPKGRIGFFDRCWYSGAIANIDSSSEFEQTASAAKRLERYFVDNGVRFVKIFLDMDEDVMIKHSKSYPKSFGADCGFLGDDEADFASFSVSRKKVAKLIRQTDTDYAPWDIITVGEYNSTVASMVNTILRRLEDILEVSIEPKTYQINEAYPNPREEVDLTKTISKSDYQKKLAKLQSELQVYQCKLATSKRALVLAFEGWDAAGKGGAIRRITSVLNPRGYKAVPVPAPTPEEKSHTHLWRFFKNVPEVGHITIFDRSWYGRMMVEPIEGFCTEEEYARSGEEINLFENVMINNGVIVLKFWIDISNEEQLERFKGRQEDPLRQWKITDEDWRNREKWDVYEKYVDSMIKQTNSPEAPWIVIEGNDKRLARVQVLDTIVKTLKKELD